VRNLANRHGDERMDDQPEILQPLYLVVLIEILILIWGLKLTAATNGYGAQVLAGTGMSVVAGIFLFLFSLLLTNVLFPTLLNEVTTMQVGTLKAASRPRRRYPPSWHSRRL